MSTTKSPRLLPIERPLGRATLRTKHLALAGVALFCVAIPTLVAPLLGAGEARALRDLREQRDPAFEAWIESREAASAIRATVELAGASAEADALRRVGALASTLDESLDAATRFGSIAPRDPALTSIRDFATAAKTCVEHALARGSTPEVAAEVGRTLARYDAVRELISEHVESSREAVAAAHDAIIEARERARLASLGLAVALSILLVVVARRVLDPAHRQLESVERAFDRFAAGDFSHQVGVLTDDDLGALAKRANDTSARMSDLVQSIRKTGAQLNSAAAEMSATSHQHQRGASEQSSAVEETQRTMQSMLASMDQINGSLDTVLRNAELTQEKNQLIAESIVALSNQADGIAEVLATIKDIANKAELLALNAALEGTKAGEVGRGFSLVATQMQRLAENVQRAVADIRQLTESIRRASTASVLSTEEGTKLAADTTRSAREIRLVMQQHQTATRQVSVAMDDVAQVASQTASSSREILASSQELAQLSERLLDATTRIGSGDASNGASVS